MKLSIQVHINLLFLLSLKEYIHASFIEKLIMKFFFTNVVMFLVINKCYH